MFRMVNTALWHDRRVRARGPWARTTVAFLMTSHVRLTIPGLVVIGPAGLAEAMGAPFRDVTKALEELQAAGLIEVDDAAPLLCLTPAPEWDIVPTAKALVAWKRQAESLPASPILPRHVPRLRAAFQGQCPSDLLEEALNAFPSDKTSDVATLDSLSNGYPMPIPKEKGKGKEEEKGKGKENENETAAGAARVFSHWHSKLWEKVSKRKAKQTAERMKPILARLADGYTEADLCQVIDAVSRSDFHLGKNDRGRPYVQPETILHPKKIDEWLATKPRASKVQGGDVDLSSATAKGDELFGGGE